MFFARTLAVMILTMQDNESFSSMREDFNFLYSYNFDMWYEKANISYSILKQM